MGTVVLRRGRRRAQCAGEYSGQVSGESPLRQKRRHPFGEEKNSAAGFRFRCTAASEPDERGGRRKQEQKGRMRDEKRIVLLGNKIQQREASVVAVVIFIKKYPLVFGEGGNKSEGEKPVILFSDEEV